MIVAFLQNTWVRDPERLKRIYAESEAQGRDVMAIRRRFITASLFAGCLTGRRLKQAFGEATCQGIYWEECSTEITGTPSARVTPDLVHIRRVLAEQEPELVLCFGTIARDAVTATGWAGARLDFLHPAARCINQTQLMKWRGRLVDAVGCQKAAQ